MPLQALIDRIRAGDASAIRDLVSLYASRVYEQALSRLGERELAREATRQTFSRFIDAIQQQPDADGWMLLFRDMTERSIASSAQTDANLRCIESELERELFDQAAIAVPDAPPPPIQPHTPLDPVRAKSAPRHVRAQQKPPRVSRKRNEVALPRERNEMNAPRKPSAEQRPSGADERRDGPHAGSILLLTLLCALLVWVVIGIAMTMQWIPAFDLGYEWFNTNLFKLF